MASPSVGFNNLGASCFLNSGVQCLLGVPELVSVIRGGFHGSSETEKALRAVLDMVQQQSGSLNPKPLLDLFYRGRQEDAAEFVLGLLQNCSSTHPIFQGEEQPRLRCSHCAYSRALRAESFLSLQLPLMGSTPIRSVQEALNAYINAEHMQENVAEWYCLNEGCLNSGRALDDPVHQTRITQWPRVLLLCLKRWDSAYGLLGHQVYCNNIITAEGNTYSLKSLITHIGAQPSSGHYVAYRRCQEGFRRFDDARVTSADNVAGFFSSVPGEKVYVIIYRKEDVLRRVDPDPHQHNANSDADSDVVPCFDSKPDAKRKSIDLDSDSDEKGEALRYSQQQAEGHEQAIIDLDSGSNKDDEDPEQPPDSIRKRKIINLDSDSNEDDKAKDSCRQQASARRLQGLLNYSEEELQQIAAVIRGSASAAEAIRTLSGSLPKFTVKDASADTYISPRTVRRWFMNNSVLSKAIASCTKKLKGSQAKTAQAKPRDPYVGSARSALDPEACAQVSDALEKADSVNSLIAALSNTLPGFSSADETATNYIPRATLHRWLARSKMSAWFAAKTSVPWNKEFEQSFSVACPKPMKRRAADISADDPDGLWLLKGSWSFCPRCGRRRARARMQVHDEPSVACHPICSADAMDLLAPPKSTVTIAKVGFEGYVTPIMEYWRPWVDYIGSGQLPLTRLLSEEELHGLAVVDIKVNFRSRRGGHADILSKQKLSVARCRWRATSLLEVRRSDMAARAFSWLLDNNSTYAAFVDRHTKMTQDSCHANEAWREVPTAELLLNTPGIEVAARPWLYPLASFADTDLTQRLQTLGWIDGRQKPSIRTGFLRKIMSRCLDYARDFPLHCLQFDVCMARTITSVIHIANQRHVAPEQIAADMDMFEGYWHQQLRKMEDICRQEHERTGDMAQALPNIFFTVAPAEWKYILHDGVFCEDALTNQQDMITLHIYHTLQALLETHLLKAGESLHRVGIANIRQWSFRFEFQSRGTLHLHAVLWADLLPTWSAERICGRTGSKNSAFASLLEGLFKSRVDVQCGDGSHALLKYVAGYLTKASDALQFQTKQAQSDQSHWRQAYRLLAKKSPMEQEMLMEFSGLAMVKHSFSGVAMHAPIPGSEAQNVSRQHYAAYQHYLKQPGDTFGEATGFSFIQWLRRYRLVSGKDNKNNALAMRNQAGPARGKDCGVAITFPFELLDIFVGAWAASCMVGMLEERLLPDPLTVNSIPGFETELLRRRSFEAPEGCRHLKAVLSLDDFQLPGAAPEQFNPDVGKFLVEIDRELMFRGLGQDRIATFKARVNACTLLLIKIRDGQEDPALWSARRIPGTPARTWSPEQQAVLDAIRIGTRISDAAAAASSNRLLQVSGGPGTGKTEVVIAAARQALQDGCRVLIAGPIGLLVSMYRPGSYLL